MHSQQKNILTDEPVTYYQLHCSLFVHALHCDFSFISRQDRGFTKEHNSIWFKKSTCHTFWKSMNLDLFVSRRKRLRLLHTGLRQMLGWVYLNCCSTSLIIPWQSKHRKVPLTSSGWTGWVRTTCPLMRTSEPTFTAVNSRILQEPTREHQFGTHLFKISKNPCIILSNILV